MGDRTVLNENEELQRLKTRLYVYHWINESVGYLQQLERIKSCIQTWPLCEENTIDTIE